MKKHIVALTALAVTGLGLLGHTAPARAAGTWNDGKHDEDTVIDCITGGPSTGVSANVGWRSPSGQVPKIGEKFYLRGYIGLVSLPCSGKVAVLPEILVPRGVEFVDEDVLWDLTPAGQGQHLEAGPLAFDNGVNGGILMGNADITPFTLRQGDVLEFQFPVRATRELRGPATQQPECEDRRDGTAPCPIDQAGDHFQVGYTVGGHGGDKSYVTPYVGLFAARVSTPVVKVASRTVATYALNKRRSGKATVRVTASRVPTGQVLVQDKGRTIGRATLSASHRGRVTVRLPKLKKGVHKLVVKYLGSSTVRPSTGPVRTVRVR